MRDKFTDASSVTPDTFCDNDYKGLNRCAFEGRTPHSHDGMGAI